MEFSASKSKWTVHADFMFGTYSRKNLASEPGFLKHIYQFNTQFQLSENQQLTVGIMPSHMGYESAKNWENETFSRSYISENSPYYETGVSWSISPSKKLNVKLFLLNGWQTIHKFNPSLGTQVTIGDFKSIRFNSSGFIGNEGRGLRIFYDNYVQIPLSSKLNWTVCEDLGFENGNLWHGGSTFLTWKVNPIWKLTGRFEYYSDPHAVILAESFSDISQSIGSSVNIKSWGMLRTEWKYSNKWGNEVLIGLLFNFSL